MEGTCKDKENAVVPIVTNMLCLLTLFSCIVRIWWIQCLHLRYHGSHIKLSVLKYLGPSMEQDHVVVEYRHMLWVVLTFLVEFLTECFLTNNLYEVTKLYN